MTLYPIRIDGKNGNCARVYTMPYSPQDQTGKLSVPGAARRRYVPWLVTLASQDVPGVAQIVSLGGEAGAIEIAKAHCGPGAVLYRYYSGASLRVELPDDYSAVTSPYYQQLA